MGLSKLQAILDSLSEAGRPGTTPIMIVSRGTRIDEQHVVGTLENIQAKLEQASLKPPALIIVGETVSFWKARNHLPIKVLHTGTNPQLFASLGHVIHHPMIILSKAELSSQDVGHLKNKLNDYDMFLFTSRYGVGYFLELLEDHGISLEPLANKPLISIGKHTTY